MSKLSKNRSTRLSSKYTDGNISSYNEQKDIVIEKVEHVISFKVTTTEKGLLDTWVNNIQNRRGSKVARAKMLRALCHMAKDISEEKIITTIGDIS
jgi:hypothetical protein